MNIVQKFFKEIDLWTEACGGPFIVIACVVFALGVCLLFYIWGGCDTVTCGE